MERLVRLRPIAAGGSRRRALLVTCRGRGRPCLVTAVPGAAGPSATAAPHWVFGCRRVEVAAPLGVGHPRWWKNRRRKPRQGDWLEHRPQAMAAAALEARHRRSGGERGAQAHAARAEPSRERRGGSRRTGHHWRRGGVGKRLGSVLAGASAGRSVAGASAAGSTMPAGASDDGEQPGKRRTERANEDGQAAMAVFPAASPTQSGKKFDAKSMLPYPVCSLILRF